MIISQIAQNNSSQSIDNEFNRLSVKRITKTGNVRKSFDFFEVTNAIKNNKLYLKSRSVKYNEIWKRVRIKIKEKLARRYLKELELYETCMSSDFEGRLRRVNSMINEYKGTSAEITQKPWYIIHPKSKFKKCWNLIMVFILLYTATIMPYKIAFIDSTDYDIWYYLDNSINFIFFIDFIFSCLTAYYDDSNTIVTRVPLIVYNYLKGWLVIDICACIPLDIILEGRSHNYNTLLRLFRLPRLYRLCKLSKVFKHLKSKQGQGLSWLIEKLNIKESHMKLISFFLTVIICSHIMTCLFYLAAKFNNFSKDTWVFRYSYLDYSEIDTYILSMYWSYTTLSTVGYGDITPCTNIEILMSLMWMVFGICFFSFTIGSLASMLSGVDTKEAVLTTKLNFIDEFAKESGISNELKRKLKAALRYSTEVEGYSWKNKREIFNELPMRLRFEVTSVMHKQAAERIKFFKDKDSVFITSIIPLLSPVQTGKHEIIYYKNEVPEEIYFINKGKVSYYSEENRIVFCSFTDGAYFGDIELILQTKRKYNAVSIYNGNLLTLNYEGINVIKENFTLIWEELERVAGYRSALMDIAVDKAIKVCEMRNDDSRNEKSHNEIKEIYNEMIEKEYECAGLGHGEVEEDFNEKVIERIAGYGGVLKKINLDATLLEQKVDVIEKFLLKS